jgi:hypothetical protein
MKRGPVGHGEFSDVTFDDLFQVGAYLLAGMISRNVADVST